MPASMMSAATGLRLKVIGSSMAIVATGPMPGSTPISVPSRQPMSAYKRWIGVTATPKPMTRLWRICSIARPRSAEVFGPKRERQRQAFHEHQHREDDEDDEEDGHFLPLELVSAVGADEDQRRGGDDESERLHQVAVRHRGGGDQYQ